MCACSAAETLKQLIYVCALKMTAFLLLLRSKAAGNLPLFRLAWRETQESNSHFTTLMLWVCHFPPHSGDLAPSREENAAVSWWRAS